MREPTETERRAATGDCYQAAVQTALELLAEENDSQTVWVCHGQVSGQGKVAGVRFGHAWVEVEQTVEVPDEAPAELREVWSGRVVAFCTDKANGNDVSLPRELYYRAGDIDADEVQRYSYEEAVALMIETEHYGPWEGEA